MIERFSSDSRFEPLFGYSRAVRCGPFVFIAGTTATGADRLIDPQKLVEIEATAYLGPGA
jgi:enamine deaminase RidA (YjgF/YER057c/UK114 family)